MGTMRSDGMPKGSIQAEPVRTPDSLTEADRKLVEQLQAKYEPQNILGVLESLIGHGVPLKGSSAELDEDYIIQKLMQVALTSPRYYDRVIALEKIARMKGYMRSDTAPDQQDININFVEKKPAGAEFD